VFASQTILSRRGRGKGNDKKENGNGISETATPHRICFANFPLPQGVRERPTTNRETAMRDSALALCSTQNDKPCWYPLKGSSPFLTKKGNNAKKDKYEIN
jgi:hypothetical protein